MTAELERLIEAFDQLVERGTIPNPLAPAATDILINWPEFWLQDHTAEEWVAWPLIPAQRQVALFAPAKTGKSIITLAVCAAVATGQPILGGKPQAPQDVLYLDYEMTAGDLHERLESLGYGPQDDLSRLHYALLPSLPPLNTPDGCRKLCNLAATVDAKVVVIDTMGRAVEGEENSSDSYREFARTTGLTLKAAGRAVLRTDHAGKNKDMGQRGSSAKNDDVDVVIRIDVAEGGWTLTRTHSRVNWVPEKVLITKAEMSDGTVTLTVEERRRTYVAGTKELANQLRGLGVTADMGRTTARQLAETGGVSVRTKRLADALAWIKAETPTFPTIDAFDPAKRAGTGAGTGKSGRTGTSVGNNGDGPQTPSTTDGNSDGNRWEQVAEANGNTSPPLKGDSVPACTQTEPEHDPESPFG